MFNICVITPSERRLPEHTFQHTRYLFFSMLPENESSLMTHDSKPNMCSVKLSELKIESPSIFPADAPNRADR